MDSFDLPYNQCLGQMRGTKSSTAHIYGKLNFQNNFWRSLSAL